MGGTENLFKKLAHAYFRRPYFSKLFGEKLKKIDMGYPKSKFRQSRQVWKRFNEKEKLSLFKTHSKEYVWNNSTKLCSYIFYKFWFQEKFLKSLLVERVWTNKTIHSDHLPVFIRRKYSKKQRDQTHSTIEYRDFKNLNTNELREFQICLQTRNAIRMQRVKLQVSSKKQREVSSARKSTKTKEIQKEFGKHSKH